MVVRVEGVWIMDIWEKLLQGAIGGAIIGLAIWGVRAGWTKFRGHDHPDDD